ncbi:MFS transporter [Solicola gregarius]|uniref:MFS transporter n=1 Tax=Solicola gregarius TaxID=2908642 RepID=A0AA46TMG5_9ACTN|nr:MFS transporter [Solicola gregarius]UYM07637.1 MFS transporter [Solicola gregarius]
MTITDSTPASPGGTWRELLGRRYLATALVLAGGVALHAVNIFLTTSLLPTAVGDIGGLELYAWTTTVFMVASVVSSMLVSRLLAARGAAGAYLSGLAPFVFGTLICAASPTMEVMLAGRAVQGFGGGLLAGLGYALIQSSLPKHLWARATALVSAMWGVGTLAGPAVGGAFAQFDAWRFAFVVLAVLGVAAAVLAPRALPRTERSTSTEPVPGASLGLLTAATAAISVAGVLENDTAMVAALLLGIALLVGFVGWERRSRISVLPAATYRGRSPLRWLYLTVGLLSMGTVVEAFTPLFGQELGGLDPLLAGFLGATVSLGWSTSMIFSSNAERESVQRALRVVGPSILAVGLTLAALLQRDDMGATLVIGWAVALMVAGSGIGLAFPHVIVAVMASTSGSEEATKASAGINTVELMSLAFGSAVAGVLVNVGSTMQQSSIYLLVGIAAFALVGAVAAVRSNRQPLEPIPS